jgi:hypothetical protein
VSYDLKYGKISAERGDVTHGEGGVPLNESDEPVFLIRAQDAAAVPAIRCYLECEGDVGAAQETLQAVETAADEVAGWQGRNADRVKVPD